MEKLCQAFENGRSLVELSEHSPHDITGVLKHFLKEVGTKYLPGGQGSADHIPQCQTSRVSMKTCCFPPLSLQLSAPVLLSHLYNDLIALAKDLQKPGEEKLDCAGYPSDPIQSMKDLLSKLPGSNYNTLRHLIAHLYR